LSSSTGNHFSTDYGRRCFGTMGLENYYKINSVATKANVSLTVTSLSASNSGFVIAMISKENQALAHNSNRNELRSGGTMETTSFLVTSN
jgi:hypothetical protein